MLPKTLARKIGVLLALKLIALVAIWALFFSPGNRPPPETVRDHPFTETAEGTSP